MKNLFIYHHLGLGDHIICNGLVREIYKNKKLIYSNIFLFCKLINFNSVQFMFKDLKNLKIIPIPNDEYVRSYLSFINKEDYELIEIGFGKRELREKYFDRDFYRIANVPFDYRWENFFVKRNYEAENKLFEALGLLQKEYVFIHDDPTRGFIIDKKYIANKNIKIVKPHKTNNIFEWCQVLENAKEIHCIDSSFRLIADSLKLKTAELFFHYSYINKDKRYISSSKYDWKII